LALAFRDSRRTYFLERKNAVPELELRRNEKARDDHEKRKQQEEAAEGGANTVFPLFGVGESDSATMSKCAAAAVAVIHYDGVRGLVL
jgi:hypothetical protein